MDLNFDQGFTGEFPREFHSLKDEGAAQKKLILMPSIIPTTAELKVDISFEPINYNTFNPSITRKRQNKTDLLIKEQNDKAKAEKLDKLRMIGRPLLPLTLDGMSLFFLILQWENFRCCLDIK